MGKVIDTTKLDGKAMALMSPDERLWLYNGFDTTLTMEILDKTLEQLDEFSQLIYDFERGLQAPALEMMMRGIRVDGDQRDRLTKQLSEERLRIERYFHRLGEVFGFEELNARSPKQLQKLFYSVLGLPEQTVYDKGKWKVSTNRASLEKLEFYIQARPFVKAIFAIRDLTHQLSVMQAQIRNGRMYTSLNIGKETGRWSSSASAFNDGRAMQNIMHALRVIFIPDPGMRICYADLKQAESNTVAHLADDEHYIEAHASGNVHRGVSKMLWHEIKDPKAELAFRHWTYYDLAKRCAHASNYFAKPKTIAKHLKLPEDLCEEFQKLYFGRFKKLRQWQYDTISALQRHSVLVTPLGRRRTFFGRVDDEATMREAIAYVPQSVVADILNVGLYRVWKNCSPLGTQILLPVHDAILSQHPESQEDAVCQALIEQMTVPVRIGSRTMTIGVDVQTGYNWTEFNDDPKAGPINLAGIVDWEDHESRRKQRRPNSTAALLARSIS